LQNGPEERKLSGLKNKFLFDDSIIVRFISLFVIGAILFTLVWHLSYHFLPGGIMQGKTGSAIIVGSDAAPTNTRAPPVAMLGRTSALLLDHSGRAEGRKMMKCNEEALGVILF